MSVQDKLKSPLATTSQALVQVRNLSKDYHSGTFPFRTTVPAVKNVSFDIAQGEIVALVGESGSGKSTIARILARLEQPTSGTLKLDGEDIFATQKRHASMAYRGKVQMVFQDPFGSLNPAHRIEHFLTRPILLHQGPAGTKALRAKVRALIGTVGLDESMLDRYPHQLSGGQRQRVAIARALAADPDVILADEPTSMLDVSVRIGILNLMRRLRDERGVSMLYITHDLASARYIADTTMVMCAGELVEGGESLELMANPHHPYTRLLLSAVPDARGVNRAHLGAVSGARYKSPSGSGQRIQLTDSHWALEYPSA
ncbi:MAG: ABC transporter ATP-binding protein [Acidobacteria bacterium]|nr:ABC transporter ATP-binding protein [Acidobacteriota bacterium]